MYLCCLIPYIGEYAERAERDVYRVCMSVIADVGRCLELILSEAEERMPADAELAVAG